MPPTDFMVQVPRGLPLTWLEFYMSRVVDHCAAGQLKEHAELSALDDVRAEPARRLQALEVFEQQNAVGPGLN